MAQKCFQTLLLGTAHSSRPHNSTALLSTTQPPCLVLLHVSNTSQKPFFFTYSASVLGCLFNSKGLTNPGPLRAACQRWCLRRLHHLASATKGSVCPPPKAWLPQSGQVFQRVTRDISVQTNAFLQPAANLYNSNVSISVGKSIMSETV